MTDTTPPIPPPLPSEADLLRPVCTPREVEAGKVLAVLSYVLNFLRIPFFFVPLVMRNDRFSLYHAKQCLGLWLMFICVAAGLAILTFVTCGVGAVVTFPSFVALIVGAIVLDVIGLVHAAGGECKPIPIIGPAAERWFKGIQAPPAV